MITKAFIDTSVFIRFLTNDDSEKYQECLEFFEAVESGKIRPYISQVVILEIIFVLSRLYSFPKKKVLLAVDQIYNLRNITVIETTKTTEALALYAKHSIKYPDCLIATQLPPKSILVTYDTEFKKIVNVASQTPGELIEGLAQ